MVLILVLGLLLGYALWTVYDNEFTPAAMDQGSPTNKNRSPYGELSPTAARALNAFGGEAVWKEATSVESTVTVGGLLFQLKGANIPPHAKITVDVQRPHTVISPLGPAGDVGVLDGFSVTIMAPDGRILEQRADAREQLQNASISTQWDRLNLLYFLGYAFWAYYTLPYQLMLTSSLSMWRAGACGDWSCAWLSSSFLNLAADRGLDLVQVRVPVKHSLEERDPGRFQHDGHDPLRERVDPRDGALGGLDASGDRGPWRMRRPVAGAGVVDQVEMIRGQLGEDPVLLICVPAQEEQPVEERHVPEHGRHRPSVACVFGQLGFAQRCETAQPVKSLAVALSVIAHTGIVRL